MRSSMLRLLYTSSLVLAVAGLVVGCGDSTKPGAPTPSTSASMAGPALAPNSADAGGATAIKDAGAPAYTGPYIGALFLQTPVMSDMEWPKDEDKKKPGEKTGSVRLGYIRQGSKVPVIPEAHVKANCKEGWYELVQGGFVCGKYASLDLNHPRIKTAPHAPDQAGSLPYQYGYNTANGTPLYRTIPSREDRIRLEPWLSPKRAKPRSKTDDDTTATDDADAGSLIQRTSSTSKEDPFGVNGEADAGTPWYLREYDGGKPQVTLDDLRGEGPVARRMVKGFFLALDHDFGSNGSRWWKTTGSLLAPYERVYVYKQASDFHGLWINEAPTETSASEKKKVPDDIAKSGAAAQIGIITQYKSKKYIVSTSKKAVTTGDSISRHSVLRLTGETVTINSATYAETDEGWWMKASEGTITKPGEAPKDLKDGEKWIDVSLSTQTLVAYEGDKPVFATAVSTGKRSDDKEKDHRTPTGTWRIREKHIAATMDGDVASDGPYSIEDVPWIMYFNGSYALHGAFWHNNFGHVQSHGCVNLAPADAKAVFNWSEPHIPEGWHGAWSTAEHQGTRVVVHD